MSMQWVKIDSWHLIADTFIDRSSYWVVKTKCGLERMWDQTFLDRLPGGDEKSCENCLKLTIRELDEPAVEEPKAKRTRKAK